MNPILLAGDPEELRELREFMEDQGVAVAWVRAGGEVIERAREVGPVLVMASGGDCEWMLQWKEDDELRQIPRVVVLREGREKEDVAFAEAHGAAGCVSPVVDEEAVWGFLRMAGVQVLPYRERHEPLVAELRTRIFMLERANQQLRQDREERLQAEEERETLFNLSGDLLCVAGFDGYLEQVNPAWTTCLGWSEEEILGRPSLDFVHPDDRALTLAARNELLRGRPVQIENRYFCKDGSVRWLAWSSHPLRETRQVFAVARDISARKMAEMELARSTRALRMRIACSEAINRGQDEMQLLKDVCGLAVEMGGYRMAWVGYAMDDEGGSILPMAHAGEEAGYLGMIRLSWLPDDRCSRGPAGQAILTGKIAVCDDVLEDPGFYWKEQAIRCGYRSVICLPLRDGDKAMGMLALYSGEVNRAGADEIKLLQNLADDLAFGVTNLRSQHERLRMQNAVVKVAESVAASSHQTFFVQLAANMAEALGAHAGYIACLKGDDSGVARTVAAVVEGVAVPNFEYQTVGTPCGNLTASQDCIVPAGVKEKYPGVKLLEDLGIEAYIGRQLTDGEGQPVGMVFLLFRESIKVPRFLSSTLQIFATRVAAELERQKSDMMLREQASLLDKARDAIIVRDLDHRILFWNEGAERLYGWKRADAVGRSIRDLLYVDATAFLRATNATVEHGEWVGEIEQRTSDGQRRVVEGHWSLVRDDRGQPRAILAINTDITDKKALEQQFLRAQRMESIGTLAGGIAHDLNNVLAPILMSIELLRTYIHHPDGREILELVGTSARRGADMVNQVLTFARGMGGEVVEVRPGQVLRDLVRIMTDTFPKNILVETRMDPDLWTVNGDPTQIHQVLLNLCVNSRDAMEGGGILTLRAENVRIDPHYAGMNMEAAEGPYVRLEVEDRGHGIPEGIIHKLFDPFFTTKEVGKGTGLGLSTSLAIIRSHGGFIRAYSEPGRGTRMRVYLPAAAAGLGEGGEDPVSCLPRGNGELILVVDDELSIREVTQRTLEAFGYRSLLAADGAQAVAVFMENQDQIEVVITDMMMPVMDGAEMVEVLRAKAPGLRIIGASGIEHSEQIARAKSQGVRYFLRKPYTAEVLLQLIRHVLAEPAREMGDNAIA